jgi:hypothetical protein
MTKQIFNLRNMAMIACLAATTIFSGCDKDPDPIDNGANIIAFTFAGIDGTATIDKTALTVTAKAKETVDLTNIVATFTLSTGCTATVNGTAQVSGQTANNFSDPVTYRVTSGDGKTTNEWTVTITGGIPGNPNAPGAVTNFTATAGNAQVSLAWNAPTSNGGSEITAYEVTMDDWTTKVTKTPSQLSHIYTGLTNGTEYTFKVRAVNANGAGAASIKYATPRANDPSNWQYTGYTLPENLKLEYEYDGGEYSKIVIKIGNDYFSQLYRNGIPVNGAETQRYFKYNGDGTWTLFTHIRGVWEPIDDPTVWNENSIHTAALYSLRSSEFYWVILQGETSVKYATYDGTETILGMTVYKMKGFAGTVYYVNPENGMLLKGNDGMTEWEVIEWDETVTDFGGIILPE